MLLSDDDKRFKKLWPLFNGVTVVSKEHVDTVKGWNVCPGSCKTCNLCFSEPDNQKRIVFNIH